MENRQELTGLQQENSRLKEIICMLMPGYFMICECSLNTGAVILLGPEDATFESAGLEDNQVLFDALVDRPYLRDNLRLGSSITREYRDNTGIYIELTIIRIDADSVLLGFKEKEIAGRFEWEYTDMLTRVKNRKYYDDHLCSQTCQGLVMADIDGFTNLCNTHGDACGDAALAAVATILKSSIRDSDSVVRYDDDAFMIAFKDIGLEALQNRMRKIRQEVSSIKLVEYPDVKLSVSFGVVFGKGTVKDMIIKADELLYESNQRSNSYTIRSI